MAATKSEIPQDLHQTPLMAASELPQDLLERIQSKVTLLPDHLVFTSVCSSWRSTGVENRQHISPKIPGLLFPGKTRNSDTRRFIELTQDGHKSSANLPVPHNLHCCGSSFGWLALVDDKFGMHLFNPFSGKKLNLPPLTALPPPPDDYRSVCKCYVKKTVLSSEPRDLGSTQTVFVLVVFGHGKLAFCRLGDERWIPIKCNGERREYEEAIYFKEKFYALYEPGGVVTIDVSESGSDTVEVIAKDFALRPKGEGGISCDTRYLVECEGELFLLGRKVTYGEPEVICDCGRCGGGSDDEYDSYKDFWVNNNVDEIRSHFSNELADYIIENYGQLENAVDQIAECGDQGDAVVDNDVDDSSAVVDNDVDDSSESVDDSSDSEDEKYEGIMKEKTVGFKLFKLEDCPHAECPNKVWKKADNIGHNAFFVGINSSFSLSSLDFTICRSNSIYFTDSNPPFDNFADPVHHDIGIYNLESKIIEEVYPVDSKPTRPPAVWFTPVPQSERASFCFLP